MSCTAAQLRNPVAPIGNVAEVLSRVLADDDEKRALTEIIRRQAMHLSEPLHINAERLRLAQAIGNVIINAAKYTHSGGDIRIRTFSDNGHAAIEVSDTGIGIPPEFLPKVFDLFAQSGRTLDRSQGGLGIGLAVCKKLVEMHGGTVTASSAGRGHGTTFTIRLPFADAAPDAAAGAQSSFVPTKRVLIVDDNRDSADSLAMLLGLDGHEVRAVYSAMDALEQVTAFAPGIVLLDIGLPG